MPLLNPNQLIVDALELHIYQVNKKNVIVGIKAKIELTKKGYL